MPPLYLLDSEEYNSPSVLSANWASRNAVSFRQHGVWNGAERLISPGELSRLRARIEAEWAIVAADEPRNAAPPAADEFL